MMRLKKWVKDSIKNRMYNKVDAVLVESEKSADKREVDFLSEKYIQFSNVFPIDKFLDAAFFTEAIDFDKGEKFLEIGVGVGVTSIIAAKKGAVVTGVDINEKAIENSIANAKLHLVQNETNFFVSDVFKNVEERAYDTIYWNVPFCYSEIEDLTKLENSVFDYKYKSLKRFIVGAPQFLKPDGRLLIGFSNVWGVQELFFRFCYEAGYKNIKILKQEYVSWNSLEFDLTLYELKK